MKEKRTNGGSLWVSVIEIEIERERRESLCCVVLCVCVLCRSKQGLKWTLGNHRFGFTKTNFLIFKLLFFTIYGKEVTFV